MVNPDLLNYIKSQTQLGYPPEQIKATLMATGWSHNDVEEGFKVILGPHANTGPKPRRLAGKTLVIVLAGILFLASAGGVLGFFYFQNLPERKLLGMNAALEKVKSLEYSGEIKMEVSTDTLLNSPLIQSDNSLVDDTDVLAAQRAAFKISFEGKSTNLDSDKPSAEINLNIDAGELLGNTSFGGSVRVIKDDLYFRLGELPALGSLSVQAFTNTWIKTSIKDLNKQIEGSRKEEGSTLDDQENRKVLEAWEKRKVIKEAKKLEDEKINGVDTHHFSLVIDKDELKEFVREVYDITYDMSAADVDRALEGFDKMEVSEMEIWVGKKDSLPYRLLAGMTIRDDKSDGKISFIINLKNFNQPLEISAPAGAKTLEEVMADWQKSYLLQQQQLYQGFDDEFERSGRGLRVN